MTLQEFRQKKKLTQQEMANRIGISVSMYAKLEQNIRKPSMDTLKKLKEQFKDFNANIFLN